MRSDLQGPRTSTGLVDVLDRVLDKGLVIAGDIKVSLAEVELLTIRIRLIVCSLDKAQEIGLDWWRHDRHLSPGSATQLENQELKARLAALEQRLAELKSGRRPLAASKRTRKGRKPGANHAR
ncbi:MAG TPA: gas vesicle protein GvpJ [Polyangia bacterium]|nr:gas vesicle protein GvpJ [Polyangia bacterium]